jgi:hypothetical protein
LKELYPSCKHDSEIDNSKYKNDRTTYGEMNYDGIETLYNKYNSCKVFLDIGSGRGKLCLYMADKPNITKSIGVELVTERYNDAIQLKSKLNKFKDTTDKVNFINKSIVDVDLKKLIGENCTLVWFSNLCFDPQITDIIFNKLIDELQNNSFIICSKSYNKINNKLVKIEEMQIPMSWSKNSNVLIYKINK